MDLSDTLNRYYYDSTVCELRQLAKNGGGEFSYNSMMYLDVISYQAQTQGCTVGSLARTLHISPSAATLKVNELSRLGFVRKCRDEKDRRVVMVSLTPKGQAAWQYHEKFHHDLIDAALTDMSEEEQNALSRALEKLGEFLSAYER